MRPSFGSVHRIGSKVVTEVWRAETLSHFAVAGEEQSSNVTRSVSVPATYITLPVSRLTPIDGSPALAPMPFGGV